MNQNLKNDLSTNTSFLLIVGVLILVDVLSIIKVIHSNIFDRVTTLDFISYIFLQIVILIVITITIVNILSVRKQIVQKLNLLKNNQPTNSSNDHE